MHLAMEMSSTSLVALASATHGRQDDECSQRGTGALMTMTACSLLCCSAWPEVWQGPEHIYFGHDAKRGLQILPFALVCVYKHDSIDSSIERLNGIDVIFPRVSFDDKEVNLHWYIFSIRVNSRPQKNQIDSLILAALLSFSIVLK